MANNKMTGIIFSNSHDDALGGLTARRSMAAAVGKLLIAFAVTASSTWSFPACPTPEWILSPWLCRTTITL